MCTPISRNSMRILYEQTLDKERKDKIYQIVSEIYNRAIHVAKNTTNLQYFHMLPEAPHELKKGHPDYEISLEFYKTNMPEILAGIQSLFYDCSVENKVMTLAIRSDGKKYDISNIDKHLKPFVMNQEKSREYIIIDWS